MHVMMKIMQNKAWRMLIHASQLWENYKS